jgi:hypothetical protein
MAAHGVSWQQQHPSFPALLPICPTALVLPAALVQAASGMNYSVAVATPKGCQWLASRDPAPLRVMLPSHMVSRHSGLFREAAACETTTGFTWFARTVYTVAALASNNSGCIDNWGCTSDPDSRRIGSGRVYQLALSSQMPKRRSSCNSSTRQRPESPADQTTSTFVTTALCVVLSAGGGAVTAAAQGGSRGAAGC